LPDYKVDDQTALWLVYPQSNLLTAKDQDLHRLFVGEGWQCAGLDSGLIAVAELAFEPEKQTSRQIL